MHASFRISTDDDVINYNAMMGAGATKFEPNNHYGEVILNWSFRSRQETIDHLEQILKILEKSVK